MKELIKTRKHEEVFENYILPLIDLCDLTIDNLGYLRNTTDINATPYSFEKNGKYALCAYTADSIEELLTKPEECALFDPINNKDHSGLLMKLLKITLFYRLGEFSDYDPDEEYSNDEINDILAERLKLSNESVVIDNVPYVDVFIEACNSKDVWNDRLKIRMRQDLFSNPSHIRFLFYLEILSFFDPTRFDSSIYEEYSTDNNHAFRKLSVNYIKGFLNTIEALDKEKNSNRETIKKALEKIVTDSNTRTKINDLENAESIELDDLDKISEISEEQAKRNTVYRDSDKVDLGNGEYIELD